MHNQPFANFASLQCPKLYMLTAAKEKNPQIHLPNPSSLAHAVTAQDFSSVCIYYGTTRIQQRFCGSVFWRAERDPWGGGGWQQQG